MNSNWQYLDAVDHESIKRYYSHSTVQVDFLRVQSWMNLRTSIGKINLGTHQVSVQRYWPDTLSVKVLQHSPIARWGDAGTYECIWRFVFSE